MFERALSLLTSSDTYTEWWRALKAQCHHNSPQNSQPSLPPRNVLYVIVSLAYRGRYNPSEDAAVTQCPQCTPDTFLAGDTGHTPDSESTVLPAQLPLWTEWWWSEVLWSQPLLPLPNSAISLVDQANLVENWYKNEDKMLSKNIQHVWLGCM